MANGTASAHLVPGDNMTQPASVFFAGMDASDAEQLTALFNEINRRSGSRWALASDSDSAGVLVIDVDTLYGHMTWLRAQSSGQTIVALTAGERADADHVLHRPVTPEALRRLMHGLGGAPARAPADAAAQSAPEHAVAPMDSAMPAPVAARPAPAAAAPAAKAPEPIAAPPVPPAPAEIAPPPPAKHGQHRLIDALLSVDFGDGPHVLELPDLPPLAFDLGQKIFLCAGGIKTYLPHAQAILPAGTPRAISVTEFGALRRQVGDAQPIARLLWLAALGGSGGEIPGGAAGARYRLHKWPQIEREFPKHFRIATAMMKGFQMPAEFAEQSGVSLAEVNEFIAASLVSGHAEVEGQAPGDAASSVQKSLLERLRGTR